MLLGLIVSSLGLFLLIKYRRRIFGLVLEIFRRGGGRGGSLSSPPPINDKEKRKMSAPARATAVNATTEEENQAEVASAQNLEGAASMGTEALARMAVTTATASTSSASRTQDSQAYSAFMNGVESCMVQFSELGSWLNDQICECEDAVDIPAMYAKFMGLPLLKRVLIAILVLAIVGLLGWITWEGVSYAWKYLMDFLNSKEGQSFLKSAGAFLQALADSNVFKNFMAIFTTATNQVTTSDTQDPPCFEVSNWTGMTAMALLPILDIIRIFFAHMTKNAMNK